MNSERWLAYKGVDYLHNLSEMEKDYVRNCIVYDSEARIEGTKAGVIIRRALDRMRRSQRQRTAKLGYKGLLMLAGSII